MGQFSLMHWLVVLVIVVLLFGVKRLPELGTGLGEAISNFKKAYKDGTAIDAQSADSRKQIKSDDAQKDA